MLLLLLAAATLHDAVYREEAVKVVELLRAGADVNAANDLGVTPLWLACENGNASLVRTLLDAGADPNRALPSGETPLMIAARGGFPEIVRMLLAKDANPNATATRQQTALMWAAANKHPQVITELLRGKANVHARSRVWSQMMAVPPHGHLPYNRQIPHGAMTALLFAAREGDLESAKLLVNAGANVNDQEAAGISAVAIAAHAHHTALVQFLLQQGADPNAGDAPFTALHAAVMHRDEAMVQALLQKKANPNAPVRTWTPTRRSSKDYHFPPALIGATPLWLAARIQAPGIVRLLIQHGADPTTVHRVEYLRDTDDPRKEATPLLHAALGQGGAVEWLPLAKEQREALRLETVRALLQSGAPKELRDGNRATALDVANKLRITAVLEELTRQ